MLALSYLNKWIKSRLCCLALSGFCQRKEQQLILDQHKMFKFVFTVSKLTLYFQELLILISNVSLIHYWSQMKINKKNNFWLLTNSRKVPYFSLSSLGLPNSLSKFTCKFVSAFRLDLARKTLKLVPGLW